MLVVTFLAWLIVRRSPLRSYPTIVFPLAGGIILPRIFTQYSGMLPALVVELAICIASAFIAQVVGARVRNSRQPLRDAP